MMQREAMKYNVAWVAFTTIAPALTGDCGTLLSLGANSVSTRQSRANTTNDDHAMLYEKLPIHEQRIMDQDHQVPL